MRKVKFHLANVSGFMQAKDENAKELGKERHGVFHKWGTQIVDEENKISRTVAIIEDEETGKVHSVIPDNIMFIDKE